ncbi:MAG: gamma carbonic anhydrase family protein [Sulfuricella sp.]|nr:gamma carbonic anhydrase family protein [Sulfuricella sp.]
MSCNVHPYQGIYPVIPATAYIHPSAQIIGDVEMGEESSIWCNTVIRGDVNLIRIGSQSNIQDLCTLHVSHRRPEVNPGGASLLIGNRVTVGHGVILHGCHIADECLIGMGCIVMDKVLVEKHVMIAAGSLVPAGKRLESGYLYLGRPVKQVRPLTSGEIEHFAYSAAHYVRLCRSYL